MKEAGRLGSEAHVFVMQNMKAGMNERHIEVLFRHYAQS
jgi:Xaa-Pro aminopeptidase